MEESIENSKETADSRANKCMELCKQIRGLTNGFTSSEVIGCLEVVKFSLQFDASVKTAEDMITKMKSKEAKNE